VNKDDKLAKGKLEGKMAKAEKDEKYKAAKMMLLLGYWSPVLLKSIPYGTS
jgi:hypothetical protein